ncbi:MAG: hemolysin III family protein [Pseudomonadota bacterium]
MASAAHRLRTAIEDNGESFYEELANTLTHGIGAVLAAAALALIVVLAALTGNAWAVTAAAIYGASLVMVYLSSALYHGIWHKATKAVFLVLDHCAIFLLIAGTYTPITLLVFPQPLGWTLFGVIWAMAFVGIALRLWLGHLHWIMIPLFLAMGWIGFFWSDTVFTHLGAAGAWLILSGGLAYTGGVVFFLWRSLPFNHALWHVSVLGGSVCHFVAIALYVVPAAA